MIGNVACLDDDLALETPGLPPYRYIDEAIILSQYVDHRMSRTGC